VLENMAADSRPTGVKKPEARSRVTNGKDLFFERIDGRSRTARRFRDLLDELARDLGGSLTTGEQAVLRQAAGLLLRAEQLQAEIVKGSVPIDADEIVRTANASTRLLASLRANRRRREPPPPSPLDGLVLPGREP
jgi:hypothetical protein